MSVGFRPLFQLLVTSARVDRRLIALDLTILFNALAPRSLIFLPGRPW